MINRNISFSFVLFQIKRKNRIDFVEKLRFFVRINVSTEEKKKKKRTKVVTEKEG